TSGSARSLAAAWGAREWGRWGRVLLVVVRQVHDVGANRFGVLRREHLRERHHPVVLQHAVDDDGLEAVGSPLRACVTQVGEHARHARRVIAMAAGAVLVVLGLAL